MIQAKLAAGHSKIQGWVSANVAFSYETASLYMRLAKGSKAQPTAAAKMQSIADLTITGAARLLAKPLAHDSRRTPPVKTAGCHDGAEPDEGLQQKSHDRGTDLPARLGSQRETNNMSGSHRETSASLPDASPEPATDVSRPHVKAPVQWPGIETHEDVEDLEAVRGDLNDALVEIRRRFRSKPDDLGRARKLWAALRGYREIMVTLMELKSPQAMADCEKCSGIGITASGVLYVLCRGTGVMVVT